MAVLDAAVPLIVARRGPGGGSPGSRGSLGIGGGALFI